MEDRRHDHRGLPIRMDGDGDLLWIVDRAPFHPRREGQARVRHKIEARVVRDRIAHQRLCFRLVWRTLRDRFYDDRDERPQLGPRMLSKYEEAGSSRLPTHATFDRVVGMLLGELNASHLTFLSNESGRSPWKNESARSSTRPATSGIRFGRNGPGGPADRRACHRRQSRRHQLRRRSVKGDTDGARSTDAASTEPTPLHRFMNGRIDRDVTISVIRDC